MKKPDYSRAVPLIVGLPVAHVLASSIFLWGYVVGFGGGLSAFVVPIDIFRVSIRHLVIVYVAGLISVGAFVFLDYRRKRIEGSRSDRGARSINLRRMVRITLLWLIYIVPIAYILISIFLDLSFRIAAVLPPMLITTILVSDAVKKRFKLDELGYEIATALVLFSLIVLLTGLDRGRVDRMASYQSLDGHKSKCDDKIVITAVSSYFIAVKRDNNKVMVDDLCRVKFTFPAKAVLF